MNKCINLDEYVSYLGRLVNLNLDKTFTTYSDRNQDKSIQSIIKARVTDPSFGNPDGVQLYSVNFNDGSNHDYAGMWISTEVEFDLSEKYKL